MHDLLSVECPHCGQAFEFIDQLHEDTAECPHCQNEVRFQKKTIEPPALPVMQAPPILPQTLNGEEILLTVPGLVTVTKSRLVFRGETVSIRAVNSVSTYKKPPSYFGVWILTIIGILSIFIAAIHWLFLVAGLGLMTYAYWFAKDLDPTYVVEVVTSSQEKKRIISAEEITAYQIAESINRAMI